MGAHQVLPFSEDELKERIIALFDKCCGEIKAMHLVDRRALLAFAKELADQSYTRGTLHRDSDA